MQIHSQQLLFPKANDNIACGRSSDLSRFTNLPVRTLTVAKNAKLLGELQHRVVLRNLTAFPFNFIFIKKIKTKSAAIISLLFLLTKLFVLKMVYICTQMGIIIFLIVLGVLLIIADILIVPGAMVSIIGLILIGVGIYKVNGSYGTNYALYTTIGIIILLSLLGYLFYKSNIWKSFRVNKEIKAKVNKIDHIKINVGDKGRTLTALRPSGTALINNIVFEVHSREFMNEETDITIQEINGNKILVK